MEPLGTPKGTGKDRSFWTLERFAAVGFALAVIFVTWMGLSSQRSINSLLENAAEAERSNEFLSILEEVYTDVREAESTQRGLILTGDDARYLAGFEAADVLVVTNLTILLTYQFNLPSNARTNLAEFVDSVQKKMAFARNTVATHKISNDQARARIVTGEGFKLMEAIRLAYHQIKADVQALINAQNAAAKRQARRTVASSGVWIVLDIGLLTAVFFFIRSELRHRRATELELAKARDTALEATRLKSEFLASMSHEIRTPMNGVIGMTGLLLDSPLTAEQRRLAETVQLSANALLSIINDILDYSKIEAGRMTFEEMDFDVQAVVESALDLLAHKAHEKGLELACLVEPSAPKRLRGDAGRLRQILVNLIGNAVKFTERGEVLVGVDRAEFSRGAALIRFSVRDTGLGIAPEVLPRLFTAFTQADSSTTRQFGGTGLGLAICKRLVEGMGGQIGAESQPGHGSRFFFTVRMAELPETASAPAALVELTGRAALVVDDNATNRLIVERQLQSWGLVPTLAASGAEALALLQNEAARPQFAIAILDLHMPAMDGMELARRLKVTPSTAALPLLLLSSGGDSTSRTAREAGFAASLTKPVKQSELYNALLAAVGSGPLPETAPTPAQASAPHGLKILVVEDNRVNQLVATGLLERLGYRADVVADGEEALEALRRIPYDLIFMDCQMPVMDGFTATRHIRKMQQGGPRRARIVAMTANAMEGDREKCLTAGMDDYLSKPIQRPGLHAMLEKIAQETAVAEDLYALDTASFDELRAIKKSDGSFLWDELKRVFFEDGPRNFQTLSEAHRAGELPKMADRAHALRGSARLFGARALAEALEKIEFCGNRGDAAGAKASFAEAERAFAALLTQLRTMQAKN